MGLDRPGPEDGAGSDSPTRLDGGKKSSNILSFGRQRGDDARGNMKFGGKGTMLQRRGVIELYEEGPDCGTHGAPYGTGAGMPGGPTDRGNSRKPTNHAKEYGPGAVGGSRRGHSRHGLGTAMGWTPHPTPRPAASSPSAGWQWTSTCSWIHPSNTAAPSADPSAADPSAASTVPTSLSAIVGGWAPGSVRGRFGGGRNAGPGGSIRSLAAR
jgi:hypothetical protein